MAKLKLELKRLSDASDKGEAVGDEIAKVQQQMGEIERQMNAIKPAWHDVMIEKWSVQAGAFVAQAELGKGKPAAEALAGLATTIVDFEKQNAPLTEAVHRRLHELLNAQPVLKDLYAKKDGKLLLEAPKK